MVGNKVDTIREIEPEDINDWVESDLPKERYVTEFASLKTSITPLIQTNGFYFRTKVLECSAAQNMNINEIFKSFLILAKIDLGPNFVYHGSSDGVQIIPILNKIDGGSGKGLRRNLSAYGRIKFQNRSKTTLDLLTDNGHLTQPPMNEIGHSHIGRQVSRNKFILMILIQNLNLVPLTILGKFWPN